MGAGSGVQALGSRSRGLEYRDQDSAPLWTHDPAFGLAESRKDDQAGRQRGKRGQVRGEDWKRRNGSSIAALAAQGVKPGSHAFPPTSHWASPPPNPCPTSSPHPISTVVRATHQAKPPICPPLPPYPPPSAPPPSPPPVLNISHNLVADMPPPPPGPPLPSPSLLLTCGER